jgi:hypothetical protein
LPIVLSGLTILRPETNELMRGADERAAVLRRRASSGSQRDVADLGVDVELLVVTGELLGDVDVESAGLGRHEVVADFQNARHARHVEHGAADIGGARRRRVQLADRTHRRGVRRRIQNNAHHVRHRPRAHDDGGTIGDATFPVGDIVGRRWRRGSSLRDECCRRCELEQRRKLRRQRYVRQQRLHMRPQPLRSS